jgi:hypothetical protein
MCDHCQNRTRGELPGARLLARSDTRADGATPPHVSHTRGPTPRSQMEGQ